jgi:SRSO17 transposase
MPAKWLDEASEAKREKCGVPENLEFKTKNQLALGMIRKMAASGKLQHEWVGCDCAFGHDSAFRNGLPEGLKYFVDVNFNLQIFINRPKMVVPKYKGRGRKPRAVPDTKPVTVKEAINMDSTPWSGAVLGIGAKGPLMTQDKCMRVLESREGLPGKDVWLYARVMEDGSLKYCLCNAPMDATIESIRSLAMMRWSIEQTFKECKMHLGMDHYELRSWTGWRRHMLLVMICHFFGTKLRLRFGHKMSTPMSVPYADGPVDLEAYLDAADSMRNGCEITQPHISAFPLKEQYILSFASISKLLGKVFPPMGEVYTLLDACLKQNAATFESDSKAKVAAALIARDCSRGE